MSLNLDIFTFFNNLALVSPQTDILIIFCAIYLGNILIVVSVLFLLFHKDSKYAGLPKLRPVLRQRIKEIALVFASAAAAWLVTTLLKEIFAAPRPFLALEELKLLFVYGGNDSFPSGHASFFAALAVSFYRYHRGIGVAFIFAAIIIGLARIAAGIHYPIDVAVGWALGGFISFAAYTVLLRLSDRYRERFDRFIAD